MAAEGPADNQGSSQSVVQTGSPSPEASEAPGLEKDNTTDVPVKGEAAEPGTTEGGNGTNSRRNSPMPSGSSASTIRSHPPPIITNSVPNNRPPSTTSVHSNSSAGPRSTTAMSRRGGRTRSRSPPMMIQRPPSSNGPPPPPEAYQKGDDRGAPPSPANPSAAAAAAAAAAKSITRNAPPPGSWYDSPDAVRERDMRRSRGEGGSSASGRYHGRYYEGGPPPPSSSRHSWPPEEDGAPGGRPPSRSRYPPGRRQAEEYYGYSEGYSYRNGSGGRPGRGEPYPPPPYAEEYERRYPDRRYDERGPPATSPRPPSSYEYRGREHRRHREDPYYKHPSKEMDGRHDPNVPHSMVKRTTRVIGTATPIHMPRAPEQVPPASRGRTSSGSIFRGRPGSEIARKPPMDKEEDNSQKILMSLRTPSTSFEEKQKEASKRGEDPLSPEAPPKIQHSHHQNTADSNMFFEPQRSPKSIAGPPQQTNSIDMAPSFTLFNQSFDSIGDTANFFSVSGPLDSTLQSTSFGAALAASDTLTGTEDKGTDLQLSASNGNFSQQLLGGSSSGGALTFGMSPNNSFGNGPSSARGGNMMVLGGQDNRSSSPTQVLDMYRSYSGGGGPSPRTSKTDESHLRMSGSMGGQSLPNSYTKSFNEAPKGQYRAPGMGGHPESNDGNPGFYVYLKRHKGAFKECSFLLPGLKAALLQAPDVKEELHETPKRHTRNGDPYGEPNPHEIAIALRRVASAVCAFGGTFVGDRTSSTAPQQTKSSSNQSIFREKPDASATVTPNSSTSTSSGGHRSRQRAKYDEMLPTRYYENDNRLSWEFEENPPVDDMGREEEEAEEDVKKDEQQGDEDDKNQDFDSKKESEKEGDDDDEDKKNASGSKEGDQPKMRYRCKLCGQPKQNHTCPYQQSLARSIGTMVYPAVNAFTSAEPGVLAPALSEMNNFILSGAESVSSAEASPSRPTPERLLRINHGIPPATAQVTPESLRGAPRGGTSPVTTPQRGSRTPVSSHRPPSTHGRRYVGGPPSVSSSSSSRRHHKKRSHRRMMSGAPDDQGDLLFVDAADLKPEQFRMVTPSKIVSSPDAFTYPALPLPYAQRKRLSDNLFSLSKEVPQLTDECAAVLREAREKDMWDHAVAELMTQVVVVVHCHGADSRFEGLRRYLLTLGISC